MYSVRCTVSSGRKLRCRCGIDVLDDGPGIPEDRLRDVIEPFVRLDPARRDRPGSVGLGLSIVREIVHAHGGTFALVNRKPTGLIARIVLPWPRGQEHCRLGRLRVCRFRPVTAQSRRPLFPEAMRTST